MHTTPIRRIAAGITVVGASLMAFGLLSPAARPARPAATRRRSPATTTSSARRSQGEDYSEHKVNEQPSVGETTTYTFGNVQIVISGVGVVGGKMQFDWSATTIDGGDAGDARDPFFYDVVLVKAGGGGTESAATSTTTTPLAVSSDTDLESPKDSISHISFCFGALMVNPTTVARPTVGRPRVAPTDRWPDHWRRSRVAPATGGRGAADPGRRVRSSPSRQSLPVHRRQRPLARHHRRGAGPHRRRDLARSAATC